MSQKPITLITGAARRIGAHIARHLVSEGHDLVLHYNQSWAEAEALAVELRGLGAAVNLVQADLENTATLASFWNGLPSCTNIIHNASRYTRDTVESFTAADLRAHLAVNLEAPLLLTQGFLAQLPEKASGNIIVLGDDALGWSASPEFFTYAVSKHSWNALIDLLAAACVPRVRVNMVALAPTLPNEMDSAELFERLAARAPLARTGTVEEVLTAIDFVLASPGMTGQRIGLGNGMALTTSRALKQ
jgi:NAD(P)-dependent dehydrogenase (short-subunit alcohol dehydrogenase family)